MSSSNFDVEATKAFVNAKFDESILDTISKYIEIPNQSPEYDADWATNGYQEQAVDLLVEWVKAQEVQNLTLEVVSEEGRTPLIFMSVPAFKNSEFLDNDVQGVTTMMYGHLDKQPPLTEDWDDDLGPYTPVVKDGKLYGRGGADDGYATFGAITAVKALEEQKVDHERIVILIEASEESGSPDLPYYVDKLSDRIGPNIDLVVCLDSGALNYDQFWLTTSLRGYIGATVKVSLLSEGVHSGDGSGIVPGTMRVMRLLLDRLEDAKTGEICDLFQVDIPEERQQQAEALGQEMGDQVWVNFPYQENAQPVTKDPKELLLNRTWRPQLAIVGADGFPVPEVAGNVLRSESVLKLSLRIPPSLDGAKGAEDIKKLMEDDPPYGAKVECVDVEYANGWDAPATAEWLEKSVNENSEAFFGKPALAFGEGGSIPFMGMLGEKFPKAQFVVTGVLGPNSNAHGPNEFMHIDMTKNVIMSVAGILKDHCLKE